jgi:uncharacterized protein YdhG (YjbR/CyaY superfamily)
MVVCADERPDDRQVRAERLYAVIKASAPVLTPRLWYGMPAYAKEQATGTPLRPDSVMLGVID